MDEVQAAYANGFDAGRESANEEIAALRAALAKAEACSDVHCDRDALRDAIVAELDATPEAIRVCEGGGPENLPASLAVTMAKLRELVAHEGFDLRTSLGVEFRRGRESAFTELRPSLESVEARVATLQSGIEAAMHDTDTIKAERDEAHRLIAAFAAAAPGAIAALLDYDRSLVAQGAVR